MNDGSSDGRGEFVEALASKHKNISVVYHMTNEGYGRSLKDGFQVSRYEYLFFTDADRQFKIESLDEFLPYVREENVDMVIGFRIDRKDPFMRKFLSWCFNRLICTVFSLKYKDIDCAFKLFKKEAFEKLDIKSDDFLFNTELLAKAQLKKLSIVQLGVEHHPRAQGKSTVSYKHIFLTLKRLFSLYKEIEEFKK